MNIRPYYNTPYYVPPPIHPHPHPHAYPHPPPPVTQSNPAINSQAIAEAAARALAIARKLSLKLNSTGDTTTDSGSDAANASSSSNDAAHGSADATDATGNTSTHKRPLESEEDTEGHAKKARVESSEHVALPDGVISQAIQVPSSTIGSIIGKKGEIIRRLQTTTGVRIQIEKNDNNQADRTVTLIGMPSEIEHAQREIFDLIKRKQATGSMINYTGDTHTQTPPNPSTVASTGAAAVDPYAAYAYQYGYSPYGVPQQSYDIYANPQAYGYAAYGYDYSQAQGYAYYPYAYGQPHPAAGTPQYAATFGHPAAIPPTEHPAQSTSPLESTAIPSTSSSSAVSSTPLTQPSATANASFPLPPTDPAAFNDYWAGLTYEQQQAYYAQYYSQQQLVGESATTVETTPAANPQSTDSILSSTEVAPSSSEASVEVATSSSETSAEVAPSPSIASTEVAPSHSEKPADEIPSSHSEKSADETSENSPADDAPTDSAQ